MGFVVAKWPFNESRIEDRRSRIVRSKTAIHPRFFNLNPQFFSLRLCASILRAVGGLNGYA